jgi:hypothetical protein
MVGGSRSQLNYLVKFGNIFKKMQIFQSIGAGEDRNGLELGNPVS